MTNINSTAMIFVGDMSHLSSCFKVITKRGIFLSFVWIIKVCMNGLSGIVSPNVNICGTVDTPG
jgi:hypothetical protein